MWIDLLCTASVIVVAVYVHWMYRAILRQCIRMHHSKTYLRKLRKGSSLLSWYTGFYLKKGGVLKEKWLTPALIITNFNLLSVPAAMIGFVLRCAKIITANAFQTACAVLGGIEFLLLAILYILIKMLKKKGVP